MFVCYETGVKLFPAILTFETGYQLLHLLRHPLFYFPFIRVKQSEAFHLQYSVQYKHFSVVFQAQKLFKVMVFISSPTQIKPIHIICSFIILLKYLHINQIRDMDGLL
jgi:hypothetical protein